MHPIPQTRLRRTAAAAVITVGTATAVLTTVPAAAATTAGADRAPAAATASACAAGHFCAFSGTNFSGNRIDFSACRYVSISWTTTGSWIDNGPSGTFATFYLTSGQTIKAPAGTSRASFDWRPVYALRTC